MVKDCFAVVSLVCVFMEVRAFAQGPDPIGIRAQGMAGAFTAVANDATAAWWNPAGLAGGAYFNAILEITRDRPPSDGAWRTDGAGFSVAYPALGLSYYRLQVSEIARSGSTGPEAGSRQDQGPADVPLRSLVINQFGATVGQSVGDHLVIGSTVKLLRAAGETHRGIDVGALAKFGSGQIGVTVRNANEPTFGSGDTATTLARQVRAGVSLGAASGGPLRGTVLAADFDVTRVATPFGDERRFAVGAEAWGASRRVGLRAGFSRSTIGDPRTTGSGGVSVALQSGTYVDAFGTFGSDRARRGGGAALRLTF